MASKATASRTAAELRAIAERLDFIAGFDTHDAVALRTIADELDGEQAALRERLSGIARLVDYALDATEEPS